MARPDFVMPEVCSARIPRKGYTTRADRKARRNAHRGSTLVDPTDTSNETRAGGPSVVGTGHGYQWAGGERKRKREGGRSRLWSVKKGRGRGGVHGKGPCGDLGKRSVVLTGALGDHARGNREADEIVRWGDQ